MENNITEILVKVKPLGEFNDFQSWLSNIQSFSSEFGITAPLFHQDCNGFATTGYDLRNTKRENVFPVKTYLLVTDPEIQKTAPYKSPSNN